MLALALLVPAFAIAVDGGARVVPASHPREDRPVNAASTSRCAGCGAAVGGAARVVPASHPRESCPANARVDVASCRVRRSGPWRGARRAGFAPARGCCANARVDVAS